MVSKLIKLAIFGVIVWVCGFGIFYISLPKPLKTIPAVQGYAVFTGGEGRVLYGLKTLQTHPKPMLITGIHPETSLPDLLQQQKIPVDTLTLLALDHTAQTTRQNIQVLQKWAQAHGLENVGLITSHYHMPRVRLLAWWHAPQVKLVPMAVRYPTKPLFYLREYAKLWAVPVLK